MGALYLSSGGPGMLLIYNDVPVPGDYDGDGVIDYGWILVYPQIFGWGSDIDALGLGISSNQ